MRSRYRVPFRHKSKKKALLLPVLFVEDGRKRAQFTVVDFVRHIRRRFNIYSVYVPCFARPVRRLLFAFLLAMKKKLT